MIADNRINVSFNSAPIEVYVKSLERSYAPVVSGDRHSRPYFFLSDDLADEIDRLPSAGVYLKDNDRLVAWIMYYPPFGMRFLFTLEGYRRRGYGKLAVQYLTKRLVQAGYPAVAHTHFDNHPSIALFESLGFKLSRRTVSLVSAGEFTKKVLTN